MAVATEEECEVNSDSCTKEEEAGKIVRRNMYYAMGAGVVPVPIFDLAAITGLQMKMLYQLSKEYDVTFPKDIVRTTLASLVGGIGTIPLASAVAGSMIKVLPGIGNIASVLTLPVTAGAITYAIGKIFVMHFESGGTFLTFNAKKMKSYFSELYEEGKEKASKTNTESKNSNTTEK